MGWAELRRAIANDKGNTTNWSDESSEVEVTQRKGFMCNIKARGRLQMEPDKRIDYRKVLEDDKAGKMTVEVQQVGQWKFLGFSGEFSTTLYVRQDKKAGKIGFQLAKPGLMRDFAGTWTVQPLTQKDLQHSAASDHSSPSKQQGKIKKQVKDPGQNTAAPARVTESASLCPGCLPYSGGGGSLGILNMLPFQKSKGSFVTLEQSILPGFVPPKPLDRVLKGISAKQVQIILQDLRLEVERQSATGMNGKIPAVKAATRLQEDAATQKPVRKRDPPSAFGS